MDSKLQEMASRIEKQIKKLQQAEEILMNLEASEKSLYANLYLDTSGTVAERDARVEINPDWIAFKGAMKDAKVMANREKRMLELFFKAGDWEYGTMKREHAAIGKPQ